MSTQSDAVGYIITLYSSKIYKKVGSPSKCWGGPDPPDPPVAAPMGMSFDLRNNYVSVKTKDTRLTLSRVESVKSDVMSCHVVE